MSSAASALLLDGGFAGPRPSLEQLAKIRGAMWTARLDLPWGPRPGDPSNCICIDYFECYSPRDQDRIIAAYGPLSPRGYTHAPMGPIIDVGYHGQLPACDWRDNPGVYFAASRKEQAHGIEPLHFLRPDRGVAGLEWTVADLDRELTPIFSTPEAQDTMRIVVLGWEPGPLYFYDNAWWIEMCQWMARVFPRALRLIHMVGDCDAPTGQDDDKKGLTNAQCWANVAPYLHGWLVQVNGYVFGPSPTPTPQFLSDFYSLWGGAGSYRNRFQHGYGDWPKFSAWPSGGLKAYYGEGAAFGGYHFNWPESVSIMLGDGALQAGADGYLDGGSLAVK